MEKLCGFLARYGRTTAVLALVSVTIPAFYLPRLQIDNSIEVWLPRSASLRCFAIVSNAEWRVRSHFS